MSSPPATIRQRRLPAPPFATHSVPVGHGFVPRTINSVKEACGGGPCLRACIAAIGRGVLTVDRFAIGPSWSHSDVIPQMIFGTVPMRVLTADANKERRERIHELLSAERSVEILPWCSTFQQAQRAIEEFEPDLALLDAALPPGGGIQLLRNLCPEERPAAVILADDPRQSLEAWEVGAVDYIVNPVSEDRIRICLRRVENTLGEAIQTQEQSHSNRLLGNSATDRIGVKVGERYILKKLSDLSWIKAERNYVRLYFDAEPDSLRMPLGEIERRLDPGVFVRIHRSIIVNRMHIKAIEPIPGGEYIVILQSRTRLTSGRMFRNQVLDLLAYTA